MNLLRYSIQLKRFHSEIQKIEKKFTRDSIYDEDYYNAGMNALKDIQLAGQRYGKMTDRMSRRFINDYITHAHHLHDYNLLFLMFSAIENQVKEECKKAKYASIDEYFS